MIINEYFSPNLTWRDVQHLVAWTSEFFPLMENKGKFDYEQT